MGGADLQECLGCEHDDSWSTLIFETPALRLYRNAAAVHWRDGVRSIIEALSWGQTAMAGNASGTRLKAGRIRLRSVRFLV